MIFGSLKGQSSSEHQQNVIFCSLAYCQHFPKMFLKSLNNVFNNFVFRQINTGYPITSLAEEINTVNLLGHELRNKNISNLYNVFCTFCIFEHESFRNPEI